MPEWPPVRSPKQRLMRRATQLAHSLLRTAAPRAPASEVADLGVAAAPMVRGFAAGLPQSRILAARQNAPFRPSASAAPVAPPPLEVLPELPQRAFSTAPARSAAERPTSAAAKLPEISSRKAKKAESLTAIQGVGKKYAQLLEAAGLADLAAVRAWYLQDCARDQDKLMEKLEATVGIKHRGHRAKIADFLREHDRQQQEAQAATRRFVTLSVEGNISAGKSTFLRGITRHCPYLQDLLHVVPEPVDRWQNVGNHNLLDQFYRDPKRYAYTFQNYIFFTRMMQEQESAEAMSAGQPYRLLERSVFCDRMVFVESLRDSNILSPMELSIYDSWFDPVVAMAPTLVPDGFIYLRAEPETCLSRMQRRARNEETAVDIRYLEDLHRRHDDWLWKKHRDSHPDLRTEFGADPDRTQGAVAHRPELDRVEYVAQAVEACLKEPEVPNLIKDEVQLLNRQQNTKLHRSIDRLPALVLNCERDLRDLEAQKDHAEKVNAYFQYVKEKRAQRMNRRVVDALRRTSNIDQARQSFERALPFAEETERPVMARTFEIAMADIARPDWAAQWTGRLLVAHR